jgi:hypothetical protein
MDDARAAERLGWARVGAERDIATGSGGGAAAKGSVAGRTQSWKRGPPCQENPFRKFTLAREVPSLLRAIAVLRTLVREPFSL